jgi:hypothetical protein
MKNLLIFDKNSREKGSAKTKFPFKFTFHLFLWVYWKKIPDPILLLRKEGQKKPEKMHREHKEKQSSFYFDPFPSLSKNQVKESLGRENFLYPAVHEMKTEKT